MITNIYINGIIGVIPDELGNIITPNVTLLDIVKQVEVDKLATQVNVFIDSEGGDVDEGYRIYDYLKALNKKVVTIVSNRCASIATVILLAGEERIARSGATIFIHNAWVSNFSGEATELENAAKEMRTLENEMINFYSKNTGTSKEAIRPLMQAQTEMTVEEALSLGFLTKIEDAQPVKALAFLNKKNTKKMDEKNFFKTMSDKFDSLILALSGKKLAMKLQDSNGKEIDFPDISEGQMPAVGDKATIDGKPAEGEYMFPQLKASFVFANGVISEIKQDGEMEMMRAKIAELEASNLEKDELLANTQAAVLAMKNDVIQLKKISGNFTFEKGKEIKGEEEVKKVAIMSENYKRKK